MARGVVPREIPDLSSYEVIDLTESDNITDVKISPLQKEEEEAKVFHYSCGTVWIRSELENIAR